MITDCFSAFPELENTVSLDEALGFLVLVVPAALCFALWRIFVTNRSGPRGGVVVLGLDDSSSVYSDLSPTGVPLYLRVVYCAVSILTFMIGVLIYEGFTFLNEEYFYFFSGR